MHRRKPQFKDLLTLLKVIIEYGDAPHFEGQGDYFHASSSFLNSGETIIEDRNPTGQNLAWASYLLDRAMINLSKHMSTRHP
jgi:hypothetical protein